MYVHTSEKIIRSTKYKFILLSNVVLRFFFKYTGQPLVESYERSTNNPVWTLLQCTIDTCIDAIRLEHWRLKYQNNYNYTIQGNHGLFMALCYDCHQIEISQCQVSGKAIVLVIVLLEYSTNIRVVHGSDGPAGRVGSGRVGSGHDFAGFWRVGSGRVSTSDFPSFSLIISWYLNQYESSNTTFGLIDFLQYLIYDNWIIN